MAPHENEKKAKNSGHIEIIHTPLPFQIAFSFDRDRPENLYSISHLRIYKKFFTPYFWFCSLGLCFTAGICVSIFFCSSVWLLSMVLYSFTF